MTPSPEFRNFAPVVVSRLLRDRAVKIGSMLFSPSVREIRNIAIKEGDPTNRIDEIVAVDPKLEAMVKYLVGPSTDYSGIGVTAQFLDREANTTTGSVHQDGGGLRDGLTALIPLSGEPGWFEASDERFDFQADEFDIIDDPDLVLPKLEWQYGLGDIVLITDVIDKINGIPVDIDAAWHEGIGMTDRELLVVDFNQSEFHWPGVSLPN